MPTIISKDREDAKRLARELLAAAGPDRKREVQVVRTGDGRTAFDVPDDLAAAVLGVPVGDAQPPAGDSEKAGTGDEKGRSGKAPKPSSNAKPDS